MGNLKFFSKKLRDDTCSFCKEQIEGRIIKYSSTYCDDCYYKEKEKKKSKDLKEIFNPEIDKISERLFLGNADGGKLEDKLKEYGVTHVLICGLFLHEHFIDSFKYKTIEIEDSSYQDIFKYFKECLLFIDKSEKVFVHCKAGISRSATIVIAYLMWSMRLSYKDARNYVKSKRDVIYPNPGFEEQLINFEEWLQSNDYTL
jgi:dual specificity phosphatase 12